MSGRIELGCPGHFICATDCQFRRHTQVPGYRISTVGNLYRLGSPQRQTLGADANGFFETAVFETTYEPAGDSEDCGCMSVANWSEVEMRRYATAGEAQAGHEAMVSKYLLRVRA